MTALIQTAGVPAPQAFPPVSARRTVEARVVDVVNMAALTRRQAQGATITGEPQTCAMQLITPSTTEHPSVLCNESAFGAADREYVKNDGMGDIYSVGSMYPVCVHVARHEHAHTDFSTAPMQARLLVEHFKEWKRRVADYYEMDAKGAKDMFTRLYVGVQFSQTLSGSQ